jgi:hypothetical protein
MLTSLEVWPRNPWRRDADPGIPSLQGGEDVKALDDLLQGLKLHLQIFLDMSDKMIIDFRMSRYGLFLAILGIEIDIVPGAMSYQNTTGLFQLANELLAFHRAISWI